VKLFGLTSKERIKSRKAVEALFSEGKTWSSFPIRTVYRILDSEDGAIQVAVSVPAKNFKKAVTRNRIKRLLRESYRLNKSELLQLAIEKKLTIQLFFIYTGKEVPAFSSVETVMKKCLNEFIQKLKSR
jgi:ribonuclease P protein component